MPNVDKISQDDLDAMVVSHERALFGYTDRDSLRIVPGLLSRINDATTDISEVKMLIKSVKKWGAAGTLILVLGQFAMLSHQYGFLPVLLRFIGMPQ